MRGTVSPRPADPEDTIPAAWLAAALTDRATSRPRLARRLGVAEKTVARWAKGEVPLHRSRWIAVLAALELPQDWQPPAAPSPAPDEPST